MPDVSDMELLQDYARHGSETAFAELVRRHVNLVYSAALRQVGIAAHAEEITQAVFVILVQKAARLRPDTILEGWFYQTARLTSLSFLRGERRRQWREQEAFMQSVLRDSGEPPVWNQLAPLLDEAMSRLGKTDREAVVLRYFKGKSLNEVAAAMRTTEAAAQSRVHRAVGKLHNFFLRRGIDSTAAAIAGAISANSIQAAPVALAKSVATAAVTKGATTSTSTLTLVKGALKIMAWTKAKTAVVAGVVAVSVVCTTVVVGIIAVERHNAALRLETYFTKMSSAYLETAPPMVLIRPSKYSSQGDFIILADTPGMDEKVMRRGCSFTEIIESAYGVGPAKMIKPRDLPAGEFDLLLTLHDNSCQALQAELKKRFGIIAHLETRDRAALVLKVVHSNPPGLKVSASGGPNIWTHSDSFKLQGYKMPDIASFFSDFFNIPVIDETKLTDAYDVDVHWDQKLRGKALEQEMVRILRDQLGLELVSANRPVEMLVVEKAK